MPREGPTYLPFRTFLLYTVAVLHPSMQAPAYARDSACAHTARARPGPCVGGSAQ
jgi:hypothetical protein